MLLQFNVGLLFIHCHQCVMFVIHSLLQLAQLRVLRMFHAWQRYDEQQAEQ